MGEGEMGRLCPGVRVTMVMVRMELVIREGKWLESGRGDGKLKGIEGEEGE